MWQERRFLTQFVTEKANVFKIDEKFWHRMPASDRTKYNILHNNELCDGAHFVWSRAYRPLMHGAAHGLFNENTYQRIFDVLNYYDIAPLVSEVETVKSELCLNNVWMPDPDFAHPSEITWMESGQDYIIRPNDRSTDSFRLKAR